MSDSITQAVDSTLSKNGVAADAAAVGEAVGQLSTEMAVALRVVWTKAPNRATDYDGLVDTGIYWVNMWAGTASAGNNQPPANDTGWMYVYGNADTCLIQEWHTSANGVIVRRCITGVWSAWEWENPPMALGVEYRTTERWQGKVVYTMLCNFGALPNGYKSVEVKDSNGSYVYPTRIISSHLSCEDTVGFTYNYYSAIKYSSVAEYNGKMTLIVDTSSDLSNVNGVFLVKYLKT